MSGSGLQAEMDFNNSSNDTNFTCRVMLSSSNLTDVDFWKITEEQEIGAIIAGVLIFIFFLVGTSWNLFILITYLVKHHLLKEPGNILLFNVAITDLLICLTTMVFSYVTAFGQEFIFGSDDKTRCILCGVSGFFLMFLILVSLHLLTVLSVDRFILLSRPLRYKRIMNRWKAGVICVVVYIICFILAVLPQVGFGEIEFNARFASCVPRFTPQKNLYYVMVIAVESLIPIIILAITNVWTYRLVSKFLKRNFRRRSTYRRRDQEEKSNAGSENSKHHKQQTQLVKVFGALFVANIVSYTPTVVTIFVFGFLTLLKKENIIPSAVYILGFVSFLMNPVLHPIIESFFVKDLRYQVSRAKTGIRRASTIIYRQTTQLMSSKALDEANKKIDETEGTPQKMTRQINFLGRKNLKQPNGRTVDDSMATEMESMPNSRSTSPHNETIAPNQVSNSSGMKRMEEGSSKDGSIGDQSPLSEKEGKMLNRGRRSVTFQESEFDETHGNSAEGKQGSSLKSPGHHINMSLQKNAIQEENPEEVAQTFRKDDSSVRLHSRSPPPV